MTNSANNLFCSTFYFNSMIKHPLLDRKEEKELSTKRQLNENNKNQQFYVNRDKLVLSNLRLVVHIVKQFSVRRIDQADLVQEGNIGLLIAAEKFDPSYNVKFSSYAAWWIKQRIKSYIYKNTIIKIPVNKKLELIRMQKCRYEYYEKYKKAPNDEKLAELMEITTVKLKKFKQIEQKIISLNSPIQKTNGQELQYYIKSEEKLPSEKIEEKEYEKKLKKSIASLKKRERLIIRLRYGFNGEEMHTLSEIGKVLNLTKERIRQLLQSAYADLQLQLNDFSPESALN